MKRIHRLHDRLIPEVILDSLAILVDGNKYPVLIARDHYAIGSIEVKLAADEVVIPEVVRDNALRY
ncbi:hypothetical protein SDC9_205203 [bioreactor metagenome]|uniref:Uncharacterized protein n=1 Tax=bioreactor metagenome TaxID=1076179 RepID=A0A645J487_9ZZZZ